MKPIIFSTIWVEKIWKKGSTNMGRTYVARDRASSAQIRQLIELLKLEGCDVLRYQLDPRYTGYDVLLVRPREHIAWRMVAVPNGATTDSSMDRWLAFRNDAVFISDSITSILRWIGVEA